MSEAIRSTGPGPQGYYLPACIVLAATAIGTPAAYESALHYLPSARKYEGERNFPTRQVAELGENPENENPGTDKESAPGK